MLPLQGCSISLSYVSVYEIDHLRKTFGQQLIDLQLCYKKTFHNRLGRVLLWGGIMLISMRLCVHVCVRVLRDEFDKLQLNSCVITNAQKVIRALGSGLRLLRIRQGGPQRIWGNGQLSMARARVACPTVPHTWVTYQIAFEAFSQTKNDCNKSTK